MVHLSTLLLVGSATVISQFGVFASPTPDVYGAQAWSWMWGDPPAPDYRSTKISTCVKTGHAWTPANDNAKAITSIVVHSSSASINGLTVTYSGSAPITYGSATGVVTSLKITADNFLSTVSVGCGPTGVASLALHTDTGASIAVNGAAHESLSFAGAAIFQILGSASGTQLTALGITASELEGRQEEE